ncbi:MAG: mechanosensitive ion channel family protein [Flammeovirgaceae bacterium]
MATCKARLVVLLFIFYVTLLPSRTFGQQVDLSSPYHTIVSHLENLQEDNYHPELAAQTLQVKGLKLSKEEQQTLAIRLKQIYDGLGYYVDVELIPKDNQYLDSTANNNHRYVIMKDYPQIYVEKVGRRWYYSTRTVAQINEIFNHVYPFGSHRLLQIAHYFSQGSTKKYLGLHLWQHIGVLLLLLIGFVAHKIFTFFIERLLSKLLTKWGYRRIAKKVMLPVARPLSILLILSGMFVVFPILQLPIQFAQYIRIAFDIIIPMMMVMVCYRFVDVLAYYLEKITKRTETTLDDQLIPLVRKSLKLFVILAGILFVLQNLDFDITGLLAGISIGGLAVALAAQDTIKNLFGSFMIFVDRPFTIGDWIVADGVDGSVVEVGFRSTRIQTFHNSILSIPNGKIADMTIDNMGLRVYRRYRTSIAITYDTPPDLIEVFIEGLYQLVENHPNTRKDYKEIHLNSFGDSSLNILFYIFFEVPGWSEELKARQEIMLAIIRLAEQLNVRFAFPTSTVHVEDFPEKQSLTPNYHQSKEEWRAQIAALKASKPNGNS